MSQENNNNKGIRLNNVAKECYVSVATIAEFLSSKGPVVKNDPNAKISEEQYELCLKEYSKDKINKQNADAVNLGKKDKKQKNNKPSSQAAETISTSFEKKVEIKVVDKIDLEAKAKPQVQPLVEEQSKKEERNILKDNGKTQIVLEQDTVKIENKTPLPGPNVVGKIDLSALNQKTRPDKKPKEQRNRHDKNQKVNGKNPNANNQSGQNQQGAQNGLDKKKKRKRLGSVDVAQEVAQGGNNNNQKQGNKNSQNQNQNQNRGNNPYRENSGNDKKGKFGNQNNSERGGGKDGKFGKNNDRYSKKNNSQQELEQDNSKLLKETLARLTANKGKTQSSKRRREKREEFSKRVQEEQAQLEKEKSILKVTEFISANELATMMDVQVNDIIAKCFDLGHMVTINQRLDAEIISILAEEFGFEVDFLSAEEDAEVQEQQDVEEDLLPRAPIVTVMGHVDHGKTSLLDYIRKTNVIAGEAGGITQHIGAYNVQVETSDGETKQITFLDTPGHEAFTAMRARGAKITDLAVIVIAADDSIMPQTKEAIAHAQAAGVPIIFAINKIDKPGADPDKIRTELSQMNLLVEDWGGKFGCVEISAKKGINVDVLLERIILEAEMLELKANPNRQANGSVIESSLDKGRGYVATVLVENGTLKVGDVVWAGGYSGKVKAMYNERNKKINNVGPAEPALILGLDGAPAAGDKFRVMDSEREAREKAMQRQQINREISVRTQKRVTLNDLSVRGENFKELKIILKGDVQGSLEALEDSLIKLSTDEIQVSVVYKAVGQISESDVMLASASNTIIIGFQVRPSLAAKKAAEREQIDIRLYSIIYDTIEDVKDAMEGMLSPEIREETLGTAIVNKVYNISKVGKVAGCTVSEGKILRTNKCRVIRDGIVVFTGNLASLKHYKDDVKEVVNGMEFGMNIEKFNDIEEGDIIECFEQKEVKKKLDR